MEAHPCRNSESNTGLDVSAEVPRPTSSNFSARKEDFVLDSDSDETPAAPSSCRSPPPKKKWILDFEEPSFYVAWKAKQKEIHGENWTPIPASLAPSVSPEPERDYLAEFEEWLATTDSVEIVG